jgi:hypothetical protein
MLKKLVSKHLVQILNQSREALVVSLFFSSVLAAAKAPDFSSLSSIPTNEIERIGKSARWEKLMRYHNRWYGGGKRGLADSADFYLHPEGKTGPIAELQEHLNQLKQGKRWYCDFPARYLYLQKQFKELPPIDLLKACKEFAFFHQNIDAESASVVFPSYFISNPGSTFGHILLRYHRRPDSAIQNDELRDYAFTFSALAPADENAIVYALKGLFGGYEGRFQALPYFYKLREYKDIENRDLWSYRLKLSSEELYFLIAHSFEMKNTYFDYFYFDENCGLHLLYLLDAVKPELNLLEDVQTFILPVDMVKILLAADDLIIDSKYIPSKSSRFDYRLEQLNKEQRLSFSAAIENQFVLDQSSAQSLTPQQKASILDTLIEYFDLKYFEELADKKELRLKQKYQLLSARSELPNSQKLVLPKPMHKAPNRGHANRELGIHSSYHEENKSALELTYRFALHDIDDPSDGHAPLSTVEIMKIRAQYLNQKSQVRIESVTALNIFSLTPYRPHLFDYSFLVQAGLKRDFDQDCQDCLRSFLKGGMGAAFDVSGLTLYGLPLVQFEYTGAFDKNHFRLGQGLLAGAYYQWQPFTLHFFQEWFIHQFTDENQTHSTNIKLSFSTNNSYSFNIHFESKQESVSQIRFGFDSYF